MARRRKPNPDQRALIPLIDLTPPARVAPAETKLYVAFTIFGIRHVRHCPSRVYYDMMLTLARRYGEAVRGSLDPRASADQADPSASRSAR